MRKCAGVWGWLFGHKFRSNLLVYEGPDVNSIRLDFVNSIRLEFGPTSTLRALAKRTYAINCVRCGQTLQEVRDAA